MKKFKVGVIGNGFVGESQAFAFSPTCEVKIFAINYNILRITQGLAGVAYLN